MSILKKKFWDSRAKKINSLFFEKISHLEDNNLLSKKKIKLEKQKVLSELKLIKKEIKNSNFLDLACGTGRWSIFFHKKFKHITAVDYSRNTLSIFKKIIKLQKIKNINIVEKNINYFKPINQYDLVWISGLLIYLNNNEIKKLLKKINKIQSYKSIVLLRDGTSIKKKEFNIKNKFSKGLNSKYSAKYRTKNQYKKIFEENGYKLLRCSNFFKNKSKLNKWKETRLKLYTFTKEQSK